MTRRIKISRNNLVILCLRITIELQRFDQSALNTVEM